MAITLSEQEYDALWDVSNPNLEDPEIADQFDWTYTCPSQIGQGYERVIQLREIELIIFNEEFHQDVFVQSLAHEETADNVEFGFHLSGSRNGKSTGDSFLEWSPAEKSWKEEVKKISTGERLLKIDIHLPTDLLRRFIPKNPQHLPPELKQLIEGSHQELYQEINTLTAPMRLALRQIFHCPFEGVTQQIYLESKCLELIALKLDQLNQDHPPFGDVKHLKPDDVNRIYQARAILLRRIDHPPSLLDLARQAGLNDRKLKQGFRAVFGTTVFGYLHDYRMVQAKQLLEEQRMNVNEVARAVGYASRSTFYKAFKKKFGVSPSNYLL
jgi:AraC family transcriptional regulator, transcriptional activator of the genes for pyochelin and ferripyochelin receptors